MAAAAKIAESFSPDFIDINMGCPAPKVANNGGGSSLLRDPVLVGKIVRSVKDAVRVPVTVKIRIGWDKDSINAVEIAKIIEENPSEISSITGYLNGSERDAIKNEAAIKTLIGLEKAVNPGNR